MPLQRAKSLAAAHLPELQRVVAGVRHQERAIRGEATGLNLPVMPLQRAQTLASAHLPELQRVVVGARHQERAIRGETTGLNCIAVPKNSRDLAVQAVWQRLSRGGGRAERSARAEVFRE